MSDNYEGEGFRFKRTNANRPFEDKKERFRDDGLSRDKKRYKGKNRRSNDKRKFLDEDEVK